MSRESRSCISTSVSLAIWGMFKARKPAIQMILMFMLFLAEKQQTRCFFVFFVMTARRLKVRELCNLFRVPPANQSTQDDSDDHSRESEAKWENH